MTAMRARLLGIVILLVVFAAGFAAGTAWTQRVPLGVTMNVRVTTELPRELEALHLTPVQADSLRRILVQGRERMSRVMQGFQPQMDAQLDSVRAAISAVLTPEQRARLEAEKPRRTVRKVEVDTVRR